MMVFSLCLLTMMLMSLASVDNDGAISALPYHAVVVCVVVDNDVDGSVLVDNGGNNIMVS